MSLRRSLALMVSVVLLASLAVASLAAPAAAARPKCGGKVATIVGTNKGEVIRGTARGDVIVAKGGNDRVYGRGGHDIICGGRGNDRILGGPGNDRMLGGKGRDVIDGNTGRDILFGGPQNDALRGGIGDDACYQGPGAGPVATCELPVKVLVIAYSDLNGNHVYDTGDVMISRLLDSNRDGIPSVGDTIEMGRYPTNFAASAFADWGIRRHEVGSVDLIEPDRIHTRDTSFGAHWWTERSTNQHDSYYEHYDNYATVSTFDDRQADDSLTTWSSSPSRAAGQLDITSPGSGDDRFIDVEIYP